MLPALKKGRPDGRPSFWVILAAWGPCGYSPVAPGTVGTLGAIPLFWLLRQMPLPAYLAATAALLGLAVVAATRAGAYWKVVDASPIVIDEVVGYLVAMAFFPWSWGTAVAGFLLFRVMDDVAAGVYAGLALAFVQLGLTLLAGCTGGLHWWCMELTP